VDEHGDDIGKLVIKYAKGIKKKTEAPIKSDIIIKLFEGMDAEIIKWKKLLEIPI